jgi:hypothetical protein
VPDERSLPLSALGLAGVVKAQAEAAAKAHAQENEKELQARKAPADPGPAKAVDPVRPESGPKAARAVEVPRRKRVKKKAARETPPTPPDPHGRGSAIDLRG